MKKIPKNAKSGKFDLWRFRLYITIICDNDRHKCYGFPLWYIRLPRWTNGKYYCGFAWGIFLSRDIELLFFKDKEKMK